jgi:hypothetical protein
MTGYTKVFHDQVEFLNTKTNAQLILLFSFLKLVEENGENQKIAKQEFNKRTEKINVFSSCSFFFIFFIFIFYFFLFVS